MPRLKASRTLSGTRNHVRLHSLPALRMMLALAVAEAVVSRMPSVGDWISHEEGYGEHAIGMAFRRDDWSVIEGAFFDKLDPGKHIVRLFEIPGDWMRFRAMDWGSAKPFCVQWYAVCSRALACLKSFSTTARSTIRKNLLLH